MQSLVTRWTPIGADGQRYKVDDASVAFIDTNEITGVLSYVLENNLEDAVIIPTSRSAR